MKEACRRFMAQLPPRDPPPPSSSSSSAAAAASAVPMTALLEGLREAAALLYNVTGDKQCFSLTANGPAAGNVGPWGEFDMCDM
jgi:hypothetical protein